MEWWQRLQVAGQAFGDGVTSFWNVFFSPNDEDDDTVGRLLEAAARTPGQAATAIGQGALGAGGGVLAGLQWVNDEIHHYGGGLQTYFNLSDSPTWQKQIGVYDEDPDFWSVGPKYQALMDSRTWDKAWQMAGKVSIGQAQFAQMGFGKKTDILNREEWETLKDDPLFNVFSGLTDAAIAWYGDPLAVAGKGVAAGKRVRNVYSAGSKKSDPWLERMLFKHTPLGQKQLDPDLLAHSDDVDRFLGWASGRQPQEIKHHPMIAKMAKRDDAAGVISGLLANQDLDSARMVVAVGFGSKAAYEALSITSRNLAHRVDAIRNYRQVALALENEARTPTVARELVRASRGVTAAAPPFPRTNATPSLDELLKARAPLSRQNAKTAADLTKAKVAKQYRDKISQSFDAPVSSLSGVTMDDVISLPTGRPTDQMSKALDELQTKTEDELSLITAAIGSHKNNHGLRMDMQNQVPRPGLEKRADRAIAYHDRSLSKTRETLIKGSAFGLPVRIISWPTRALAYGFSNKRAPSWVDTNRGDTSDALTAYMRQAGVFDSSQIHRATNDVIEALTPDARREVFQRYEHQAIVALGRKYGLTREQAEAIASEGVGRRNKLIATLKEQQGSDNVFGVFDEDGNASKYALFETQEVNSVPLKDLQAYERVFKKHHSYLRALGSRSNFSIRQFTTDAYEVFNGLWSGAQLLRGGYMVRNLTDDTLRNIASLGILSVVGHLAAGVQAGLGHNLAVRGKNVGVRTGTTFKNAAVMLSRLTGVSKEEALKRIRDNMDSMGRDLGSVRTQSALGLQYGGYQIQSPYSGKAEAYQRNVGGEFTNISDTTDALTAQLRNDWAEWDVLPPGHENHLDSWAHALHNQIGKSELGRKFLEGQNADQVKRWLRTTREGRAVLRKVRKADPDEVDELVGRAQAVVDMYAPVMDNLADPMLLRKMALEGKVTSRELERLFPNVVDRPTVHGPMVDLNLSQGAIWDKLQAITSFGFKWLAQVPTNKLIRHPTFRTLYMNNVRRNIEILEQQNQLRGLKDFRLTDEDLRASEAQAREEALKQINRVLYDGSTKSNIAHKLRFVTAFFSAWEDSLTKWARITMDKPHVLFQGAKIWNAPNEMSLGSTVDPATGQKVPRLLAYEWDEEKGEYQRTQANFNPFEINEESFIQARLPEPIARWLSPTGDVGPVDILKPSANLIMQGSPWWLPGAGPLTQIGMSEFALRFPTSLKSVVEWALPYGPTSVLEDPIGALAPAWFKRLRSADESVTDGSKVQIMTQIAQTEWMRTVNGERTRLSDKAFIEEVEDRTEKFFMLRAFTSFFSPVNVQYRSPYQFYIDRLRELKAQQDPEDPQSADEKFLERFGEDFWIFTTAVSKSATGLPATAEAWDRSQKIQDLIAEDPEMAGVYLGKIGDQEFDQYVYEAQMRRKIKPGSDETERRRQSAFESLKDAQRRQGWRTFTQYMDIFDAYQFDDSVDQETLGIARRLITMELAKKYPEFARDYFTTDAEKVPENVSRLTKYIVDHPEQLKTRGDIRALANYLTVREQFQAELDARADAGGHQTLAAESNRDLAQRWETTQKYLAESNTLFGRIYWRFLSNDALQRSYTEREIGG